MQKIKTPKAKLIHQSEDALHKACIQWFDIQYPKLRNIRHHSPNENPMTNNRITIIRYNTKQSSMGRVAGWPDLQLFYNGKILFIEFKTVIGRIADNQKNVFADLEVQGFPVHIIRTFEDFQSLVNDFIKKYSAKQKDTEERTLKEQLQ